MEEQNLVVKTQFNSVKNAIVVDSHVKVPRKSPGEVCKAEGENCELDSECCAPQCPHRPTMLCPHYCHSRHRICMSPFELHKADNVAAGIGEEKLVVKTMFNPVKNAMVVDSHIKAPKQSQGKVCRRVGQECDHDHKCCDNHICEHYFPKGKKICRVSF